MKSYYGIYFCMLFLLPMHSNAQELLDENNLWSYVTLNWETGELAYTIYKLEGDTTISNNVYKKIYSKPKGSTNPFQLENHFIRKEADGQVFTIGESLVEQLAIHTSIDTAYSIVIEGQCEFSTPKVTPLVLNNNATTKKIVYDYNYLGQISDSLVISSVNGFQWLQNVGNLHEPFEGFGEYCPRYASDNFDTALACFFSNDELLYGQESNCIDLVASQEIEANIGAIVYPNPFSERIEVKVNSDKIKEISITDSRGLVYYKNKPLESGNLIVETVDFPIGVYLVSFIGKHGEMFTQKIVKML